MSVRSLGSLTLDMVLKTGNFLGPMDKAARNTKSRSQEIKTSLLSIGKAVTAVSAVASAGAVGLSAMSKVAAENARQIRNMADVSNTTIEQFQRLSYGSKSVGIEGEKLADIYKDVNDRIGDFVQTGGGPMADFFENIAPKVGVTADEFQRLSGPEALQLFYDSLEKANLSQKDMTFYLEAMASDVTALVPLLRNGGAGFTQMANEANRANAVLSTLEVERLEEVGQKFQQLEQQLTTETARAVSQFDDLMKTSLEGISDGVNRLARGFNLFMDDLRADENKRSLEGINAELGRVFDNKARLEQRIDMFGADSAQAQDSIAALEEVKDQYDALITRRIELERSSGDSLGVPEILNLPRLKDDDDDNDETQRAAEKAAQAITGQILALEQQASTLGLTADEIRLYGLAQDGATDSQLAAASAALETISAYEASEKSAEDYQQLLADLRTTEEELTAQMYERLAVLDAANVSADEYAEIAGKIAGLSFEDAPEYSGLDALIGGAFGELNKIEEAEQELQQWYDRQLEQLEQNRQDKADMMETWNEKERAINEEHQNELMRIEQARHVAQLAAAESTFGDLAGLASAFAGEQSGIYRSLFAVEKAFAIGKALINAPKSYSDAYAAVVGIPIVGPALAPVAGATAAAAQVAQASAIGNIGMAHDGIDSIPETGSWFLEKGERVTTSETSAKLDATLARVESQMNRPGAGGGGGSAEVHFHISGKPDQDMLDRMRAMAIEAIQEGGKRGHQLVREEFYTNGPLNRFVTKQR